MPYAPTVNDNSGQIYAGYQTKAADITAAGNEKLASGIMRGATSALGGALTLGTGQNFTGMIKDQDGNSIAGLGDAFNKMQDNAAKANGNVGLAQALNDMYSQYGTPEQQSTFAQGLESVGNNPDKQAAYLTAHFGNINNIWKQNNMNAQYDNAVNLANYKSQLQTTQAVDRQNAGNAIYTY